MMIRILGLLLVVQLALTAWVYWPREVSRNDGGPLLAGEPITTPSQMVLSDGESTITLERTGDQWLLENGLPADPMKVTAILQALTQDDAGYAIANSDSAAQRFEVAEDGYQRRIEITGSGQSAVAYLGTSPSFRKLHARREGDDGIHVLELNSYDAPTAAESWLDRNAVAISGIERIEIGDIAYRLSDGEWSIERGQGSVGEDPDEAALTAAETANGAPVDALIDALASLRVTGLATGEDIALLAAGEEVTALAATASGTTTRLTVRRSEERFFLRSSNYDADFTLSQYDAERLRDAVAVLSGEIASEELPGDSEN